MTTTKMPTRHRVAIDHSAPIDPPRLGKIRLGVQAETTKNGKKVSYPKAVDHFVVNVDESGITSQTAVDAFTTIYGTEARTLHVMLFGDTVEDVIETAWRMYGTSKLKRRCDGQTSSVRQDAGGWVDGPCQCAAEGIDPEDKAHHCQLTTSIWIGLPDLPLGPGLWEINTGSEISERTLREYLRFIQKARGNLLGYEFDLSVVPTKVSPDGKTKTVYTLAATSQGSQVTLREVVEGRERAGVAGAAPAQLPPPVIDVERDHLISPTAEEEAAGEASEMTVKQQCEASYAAMNADDQARLQRLVVDRVEAFTSQNLVAEFGDNAADLPTLLATLEALIPTEES